MSNQSPKSSVVNGSSTDCRAKNTAKRDLELNLFDRGSIDISVAGKEDKSIPLLARPIIQTTLSLSASILSRPGILSLRDFWDMFDSSGS